MLSSLFPLRFHCITMWTWPLVLSQLSRFQELSSILEPGRTPKTDKAIILSNAIRMVNQLRDEAKKLKESHDALQDKLNELKVCLFTICLYLLFGSQIGLQQFFLKGTIACVLGWEDRTSRWEAKVEGRERDTWTASESFSPSARLLTPCSSSFSVCRC